MPVQRRKAGQKKLKHKSDKQQSITDKERARAGQPREVYRPGVHKLEDDEELDYDPSAYDCLHQWSLDWPCLSFDVVSDSLGAPRTQFPHTAFLVSGTQAAAKEQNYVSVMRVAGIAQGRHGKKATRASESGSDSSTVSEGSDEDEDDKAKLHLRRLARPAPITRLRCMRQQPGIVAVMDETGQGSILNVSQHLTSVAEEEEPRPTGKNNLLHVKPLFTHTHSTEGFAVDWSRQIVGALATGDCNGSLHVWEPREGGKWAVSTAYRGHSDSVEDVQWSPSEATVLASACVDKNVRIYDTRDPGKPQLTVPAHESDVNVISWNALTAYMLASGADDGVMRIWDLRALDNHVASFVYHQQAITGLEWCPHESSMLVASCEDNTVSVWDLALERDPEEEMSVAPDSAVVGVNAPPQLLFLHAGQRDIKEVHWHPQIPGLLGSTAGDCMNLFKPANVFEGGS